MHASNFIPYKASRNVHSKTKLGMKNKWFLSQTLNFKVLEGGEGENVTVCSHILVIRYN